MNTGPKFPSLSGLRRASGTWWALVLLLVLCFALGGSARGDVVQLIVLRPLAVVLLGYGLWTLQWNHVKTHKFLWVMAIAIVALPAIQLVPLPPAIWQGLPGRDLIAGIDHVAGLGDIWRPLTLTPLETRNALFASFIPLGVFVLGMQLSEAERFRLLPVVLMLGGLSALIGLLQTLGDPKGPLYFYPITNNGLAVGLFANRNHQAVLLAMMLPMLAVFAVGERPMLRLAAWIAGFLLLPLILITGSRLGVILTGLGLAAIPLVLGLRPAVPRAPHGRFGLKHRARRAMVPMLLLLGLALVVATIWLGRGVGWDRLFASGGEADLRFRILPTLFAMIALYLPFGSGMGSFERVFQVHEPDELLSPTWMNHAHNDWLEVLLTGGIPAVLLLFVAIGAFYIQTRRAWRVSGISSLQLHYARLGLVLIALAAVASVSDYPLRTPSLAALFTLGVLWAGCSLPSGRPKNEVAQTCDS